MNPQERQFKPGDKIGHSFDITIIDKLGEGGMGIVYEAQLRAAHGFEKRIALKFVRPVAAHFPDQTMTETGHLIVDRLVEEAKLVSNLIHTHIVQIYLLGTVEKISGVKDAFIALFERATRLEPAKRVAGTGEFAPPRSKKRSIPKDTARPLSRWANISAKSSLPWATRTGLRFQQPREIP